VKSARELFPKAYIHFEDFGLPNGEFSVLTNQEYEIFLTYHS
jgi:hypothetical protein